MNDAILSYHMDPLTCGVANFNQQLADRLGVPCLSLLPWPESVSLALVSVKASEMTEADRDWLREAVYAAVEGGEKPQKWALEPGPSVRRYSIPVRVTVKHKAAIQAAVSGLKGVTVSDFIRAVGRAKAKEQGVA